MKISKLLYSSLILLSSMFTSCEQDNIGDIFKGESMGVTFATEGENISFPAYDYEGFSVELIRANSSEAKTVELSANLIDGKGNLIELPSTIKVPSAVDFKEGETITSFFVEVGDIKSGTNYKVVINIVDESLAPIDAKLSKTFSIFRDYKYTSIGEGVIKSSFFSDLDGNPYVGPVEVLKADDINWYKLVEPYFEGYDIILKIADDGKTVLVENQTITNKLFQYGAGFVAGTGELVNGIISLDLEFTVDVGDGKTGSFGNFTETITLP